MGDRQRPSASYGWPDYGRDEAITPPNEPMIFDAIERESFRRVSDTLEDLQSNIDSHLRDLHTHRVSNIYSPSPIPSSTESTFLPITEDQPEDQLEQHEVQDDAYESQPSTPASFDLPIMQFESPPASPSLVHAPVFEPSELPESEFFDIKYSNPMDGSSELPELESFNFNMASLRAFFNPVAPSPVAEAYESSEPESFDAALMLDIASVRAFSNPADPSSMAGSSRLPELETLEVPIMLDAASVRAFSDPVAPSTITGSSELPEPETVEVPFMLDVASVQAFSNPAASSPILVAGPSVLPHPDTFEISEMCLRSSSVMSSSVSAHGSIESLVLPPQAYLKIPATSTPKSVASNATAPGTNRLISYTELATHYFKLAAHHPHLSVYHSGLAVPRSNFSGRYNSLSSRHFILATQLSQLSTQSSDLATYKPHDITFPDSAIPSGFETTLSDLPGILLSNFTIHPGTVTPHPVVSNPAPTTSHPVPGPRAHISSTVSNSPFAASRTTSQPNLFAFFENATAGDEPIPPQQQIIVGIPVDRVQSMTIPGDSMVHQVPPWIVLTEDGSFVRALPPLRFDGTMELIPQVSVLPPQNGELTTSVVSSSKPDESALSTARTTFESGPPIVSNAVGTSAPLTVVAFTPGSGPAVLSDTDDASDLSTPTISATGLISPVKRAPIRYQLALVAAEYIAVPSTPARSVVPSEWNPPHYPSRTHIVGTSAVDSLLGRTRTLHRSTSSPATLPSPPNMLRTPAIISSDQSFRLSSPIDLSSSSDPTFGLQLRWSNRHAPEGIYQDPRATVFLTPLASFVATPSSLPTPSEQSSSQLGVVNSTQPDSMSSDEAVESNFPPSEPDSESPRSSYESSAREGALTPTVDYTNGVHARAHRRFLIDGADDSPVEASEEQFQTEEKEKSKDKPKTAVAPPQSGLDHHRLRESWVYLEAPMHALTISECRLRESALAFNLEAGGEACDPAESSPRVFWPGPRTKEEIVALVMEGEAFLPSLHRGEEKIQAGKVKLDHPWNYD
ncbi:uncharacterized protein N7529_010733 [Penicillium soppii]|uniref:uncharacterized protein n=1 Tax=Penicillium soppii TaxID=69789 RepID=UPI0025490E21|nr:uncharacterized protein N7529_010733 [Penicillium soppii]KAJ5851348.1 hypothetical protein N7529_010733 [Penicillium soppii]